MEYIPKTFLVVMCFILDIMSLSIDDGQVVQDQWVRAPEFMNGVPIFMWP